MTIEQRFRSLLKVVSIREFTKDKKQVFYDFLEMTAIYISNSMDHGHLPERTKRLQKVMGQYTDEEEQFLLCKMAELQALIAQYVEQGEMADVLGRLFWEMGLCDDDQAFTPDDVSRMVIESALGTDNRIYEKRHFTYYDGASGSGSLLLAAGDYLMKRGIPYWKRMVACAVDVDRYCAYMAYIQLSFYGFSAVVVHGNTITQDEFGRWYTPLYVNGNWIFQQRFQLNEMVREPHIDDVVLKYGANTPESQALRLLRWGA